MELNIEKNTVPSSLVQTDQVTSPILQQCLYLIRNATEFRNLTCRVTKTHNDLEVVVVYREGVLGIFGPPVDPITLTLDPKGRCLLTVLFKPVQRVHIVSPESGHLQIESLLAVLRLISGKGYLFCPGLPERFLAGKACGKFVVLHGVPFKRYQSSQCPVYYQAPVLQQNSKKSSLCALCPRCIQAAKLIQTLPNASNAAGTPAQMPRQFPIFILPKSDQSNAVQGISIAQANDNVVFGTKPPTSISKLQSLADFHNATVTSVSNEPQKLENTTISQRLSGMDVNGNSQTTVDVKGNILSDQNATERHNKETSADAKIQMLKTLLSTLLQDDYKKESMDLFRLAKETAGFKAQAPETNKTLNDQLQKGKLRKRNVCRLCKKHYSTPANLLNHLQRHEVLSGSWQKRFKEQKQRRKPRFYSVMHTVFQGSKAPSTLTRKKLNHLSETSIRIFLKCLDDIITPQNGSKSFKQEGFNVVEDKIVEHDTVVKQKCETAEKQNNCETSQLVPCEQSEIGRRSGVKRTSRGLSPMQTLLEAAAIAEVGHVDLSNPIIASPSALNLGIYQDASVESSIPQLPISAEQSEVIIPQKKRRQSSRLASKRAKKNKKKTAHDESCTESVESENAVTSHEQSMLTNLNLLSTVSLETAMRQAPITLQTQTSFSSSIPLTVQSPESKKDIVIFPAAADTVVSLTKLSDFHSAYTTSKSVGVSQQMHNNTSGGNVVISRSLEVSMPQDVCRPFMSANLQASSNLPPLPPLLFAGDVQGKNLLYPLLQKQQGQDQTVTSFSPSLSTMRSLVTVDNKQSKNSAASLLAQLEAGTVKNHSNNSDCGAMDLSKPKLSQVKIDNPVSTEKGIDLSCLPHNIAQLVAANDNPSEVLQCLLLMAKPPGSVVPDNKETMPLSTIINDKQADSDLQARMFASAGNYRIDKGSKRSQQVQSVIASSSRITQPGKGMKPGGVAAVQAEEIQCGYKWSGSGGSVKERTHMVRELVPPDVMASFLTKSLSNTPSQQLNVSLINTSQPQQPSPQHIPNSGSERLTQNKSQDQPAPELALNLITSRNVGTHVLQKGIPGKAQKSAVVVSSPPPAQNWSPVSQGYTQGSILRTSLTNTSEMINKLQGRILDATSPQRLHSKTVSVSVTSSPSPSTLTITSPPPSNCSISSPSLAAMLRQPAATAYETNHSNILNSFAISLASPVSMTQRNPSKESFSVLSLPRGVQIKAEPVDSHTPDQDMIIMALPVKTEKQDADLEKSEAEACWDADSSPTNLVVDLCQDTTCVRNVGKKLKSRTAVSRTQDLAKNNNSVRCEH